MFKERWIGQHISISDISPAAAEHGDANFYVFQSALIPRYGLTHWTELSLSVPYIRNEVKAEKSDEHHRDEVLSGLEDLRLTAKHFFRTAQKSQFAGIFGLSLPTGKLNQVTRASYLSHAEAEELGITLPYHSHLRLGTGTVDLITGVEALYGLNDHWTLYGNAVANLPLYSNRYGYRTAPNVNLIVSPARLIRHTPPSVLGLSLNLYTSRRDRFYGDDIVAPGGTVEGFIGVPNTGRFELTFRPNFAWGITNDLTLNFDFNLPLYTRIQMDSRNRDVQLTEPVGSFLRFSWNFRKKGGHIPNF